MKELLTYVAQNLVEHPEQVSVNQVIGRQGRIAKEIRILMRSVAQRSGKRVSVEIVD